MLITKKRVGTRVAEESEGLSLKTVFEFTLLGIGIAAVVAWLAALVYVLVTGGP